MNPHILQLAAVYVNGYRDGMARRGIEADATTAATLRGHVSLRFGPVYAALLCP